MRMTMSSRWIPVVLIGLGALLSASPPATAQEASAKPKSATSGQTNQSAKQASEDERDYYTLRAKKMLEEDKADVTAKPHPLAVNYPDDYVTVCEGGCKNRQAHIVDFEPRKPNKAVEVGELIPTAAGSGASARSTIIECVGGCPRGNGAFAGVEDFAGMHDEWDGSDGSAAARGESGRWMSDRN